MPTSRKARQKIVSQVPMEAKKIFELGSGWGGLAFGLAKTNRQAHIYAFEISIVPWLYSVTIQKLFGIQNITFYRKNFYTISLREADVIVCYLFPGAMNKIGQMVLRQGAVIISNSFTMPGWKPERVIPSNDWWNSEIFVYRKGKN